MSSNPISNSRTVRGLEETATSQHPVLGSTPTIYLHLSRTASLFWTVLHDNSNSYFRKVAVYFVFVSTYFFVFFLSFSLSSLPIFLRLQGCVVNDREERTQHAWLHNWNHRQICNHHLGSSRYKTVKNPALVSGVYRSKYLPCMFQFQARSSKHLTNTFHLVKMINKSCQKPTIELAGQLRKNLILAHKDMSEVLLASKSLLHVDTNHRNLYSIYS